MKHIFSNTKSMLEDYFISIGEKKFKAIQVFEWLYQKKVHDFTQFSNVKKGVITRLQEDFSNVFIEMEKVLEGKDVKKFLFRLVDGEKIEAVLMEHDYGLSVCVSSQVGCNMGCKFCESGRLKKVRNLETYEIVEQILLIEDYIGKRIDSVVVMGIGEPFDNYDNIINFIKIINDAKGLAIGARHITVSTCGLVPKIKEFSDLDLQVNLAISLHGATNEVRNQLMPVNKVYSLDVLIPTLKEYITKTNRRVTIEYVMLNMVNDKESDALELAELIRGMNVYVNLIPYNETSHIEFNKSNKERINQFYKILKEKKINVTVRREFGGNIKAACGQLRSESDKL
ncbi:MAG: 23S rRNA (adenine(2503)-C(2))-methyltransferase RlmN [Bacilli bacterium]|nr:23S rRNA (adenine(2503)-C(2))-methyltransferase RlmN [Bacilli bacterium]